MTRPRVTALYWIITRDSNGRELDKRDFIGTADEAVEELEAEYNEHHSRRWDTLWQRHRLHMGIASVNNQRCRVTSPDDRLVGQRIYELERITPFRQENTDV